MPLPLRTSTEQKLEQLAEKYGTPLQIYDEQLIRENARKLLAAFRKHFPDFQQFFAVKALPNPAILKVLRDEGCGMDCSSSAELYSVKQLGIPGDRVIFTSNFTSKSDLAAAFDQGVIMNLDDVSLVDSLVEVRGRCPELISFRLNPDMPANNATCFPFAIRQGLGRTDSETKSNVLGGPDAKFGVPPFQIVDAYRKAKAAGATRFGIHMMTGSCVMNQAYWKDTVTVLFDTIVTLKKELDIEFEFMNIGGGLGIPYRPDQEMVDIESISQMLRDVFDEAMRTHGLTSIPRLAMENGRFMTGPFGWLVTRCEAIKSTYGLYYGVDACMAHLMRPGMYGSYHHITIPTREGTERAPSHVVGTLCENNDWFAKDRSLPTAQVGDLFVIHDTGAHAHSMGFQYNGKLRAPEILIRPDGSDALIRKRETYDALYGNCVLPEDLKSTESTALVRSSSEPKQQQRSRHQHSLATSMRRRWSLALSLLAACARASNTADPISTAVVTVKQSQDVFYGSSATDTSWGGALPSEKMHDNSKRGFYRVYYNSGAFTDRFGCSSPQTLLKQQGGTSLTTPATPFVLLVDRGKCEYAEKAYYAQQLGASALVVTDTLEQVANRTLTARNDVSLSEKDRGEALGMEFSCARGQAQVEDSITEAALFNFTASGWAQLPNVTSCTGDSACESSMCVPTGVGKQVCCAWDIPDAMGFGHFIADQDRANVTIPVIRLNIADGEALKSQLRNDTESLLTFYERDPPMVDPAQFIIWLLAVATVMTGGYKGAEYERTKAQLKTALVTTDAASSEETAQARVAFQEHEELAATEEVVDLTVYHAVAFLVIGSAFLLLLFYVDVVLVIVVGFAIGSVSCAFQELWGPLLNRLKFLRRRPFQNCSYQSEYILPALWTVGDLLALVVALGVSIFWFVARHENFSWVFQDIFGICFCMVFLKTVRLPNLKIATVLLVLVFCYDVFMVFISPLIFKESVMIKAATGGSQAKATASSGYCLRYPTDTHYKCLREQMPILLRMPKVIDWRDGYSMLGLGDIVLPGLLLVLCARYDYATRGQLYGKVKPNLKRIKSFRTMDANASAELDAANSACSRRGIFGVIMWGYALGLFFANLAVVLMKEGQPALMYLVPCTLGPLSLIGWRRGILKKLWDGPPELQLGYNSGLALDPTRHSSLRESVLSLEQGGNEMVLMMDTTPVSTSYARSEATPNKAQQRESGSTTNSAQI